MIDFMFILEMAEAVTIGALFIVTIMLKMAGPGIWTQICFTFTGIQMDVVIVS